MKGQAGLFQRSSALVGTHVGVGNGATLAMHIGTRIFLQNQLGCPLDQILPGAQPGKPAPEGDVAQLTAVVLVGVTRRRVLVSNRLAVSGRFAALLLGQVFLGFGQEILFDEPFVRQGERRIFGENRPTVAATEPHAPGEDDLDEELVEFLIEHAEAELAPGAVVLGEGRGKWQRGQAVR